MGADVKQTAEQFEQVGNAIAQVGRTRAGQQGLLRRARWQAFSAKAAATLLLEIGLIKAAPANMDTLFDTTFLN